MITQIGGEDRVRALVERFYDLVETLPEASQLLAMHQRGHGLAHARPAQVDFLTGFLGGRRLYVERHGPMDLRAIHAHLQISQAHAETWLALMTRAMADVGLAEPMRSQILTSFRRAAQILVNVA